MNVVSDTKSTQVLQWMADEWTKKYSVRVAKRHAFVQIVECKGPHDGDCDHFCAFDVRRRFFFYVRTSCQENSLFTTFCT